MHLLNIVAHLSEVAHINLASWDGDKEGGRGAWCGDYKIAEFAIWDPSFLFSDNPGNVFDRTC